MLGAGRAVPAPPSPECRVRPAPGGGSQVREAGALRSPAGRARGSRGGVLCLTPSCAPLLPHGVCASPRLLTPRRAGRGRAGLGVHGGDGVGRGLGSSCRNIKTTESPSPPTGVAPRARKMCGPGLGSAPRLSEVRLGEPRTPRTAGTPPAPALRSPLGGAPGATKQNRGVGKRLPGRRRARLRAAASGGGAGREPRVLETEAGPERCGSEPRSRAGRERWEFYTRERCRLEPGNGVGSRTHCLAPLRL